MRVTVRLAALILVTLAMSAGAASIIHAEDDANPLDKNNWALQFGILSDLRLGAFESGDISFKQRLSPRSALRYGISIYYYYSGTNYERHDYWNDISVIYQRYVNPDATAKFYWGVGPYLHFEYEYHLYSREDRYNENIGEGWGVGLNGIGGVEWFVTDVISLHAEYRINAIYEWDGYRNERKEPDSEVRVATSELESFRFYNSRGVLFGLSVYF